MASNNKIIPLTGLIAFDFFIFQSFFSQPATAPLDWFQKCSFIFLVLALPCLVTGYFSSLYSAIESNKNLTEKEIMKIINEIGKIGDVIGLIIALGILFNMFAIALFFSHIFLPAGIIFFLASLICGTLYLLYSLREQHYISLLEVQRKKNS